ncbi:MAG TPA: helicase, partial [Actinomycetota bacterium]|nr:helicase [Actinomycetota bacterium]
MRDRVFRTTRGLLHDYKRRGLLAASTTIPRRHVEDVFLPMTPSEKALYQRIEEYITRYYNFFMSGPGERKPLGFIMTIYRRRLTSSFQAIERSLQRRLDVLRRHAAASALLDEDDIAALESSDLIDLLPVRVSDEVREEIAELESFLGELREREPDETKAKRLHEDIEAAFTDKHDTVVLFTQYADTMRYLRDRLRPFYGSRIACYSGAGGE